MTPEKNSNLASMVPSHDHSTLQQQFERFDVRTPQADVQEYLSRAYERSGLRRVLDLLWEWESRVGYFNLESLKQNRRYHYYDEDTAVTLRAQINFARNQYTPQPPASSNSRAVHCAICYDNLELPGKEKLRVFRFLLTEESEYFVQVTPFPLFEKHFVVITMDERPMQMSRQSLADLVRFVELAPGYVGCSNSDVEWAGASILAHHHYQVFDQLDLPIMHARFAASCYGQTATLAFGLLDFPLACCKVTSTARAPMLQACGNIIAAWKQLEPGKNTCNLVVVKEATHYCCYILFRHPAFRTAEELLAIKSEGVGVIEVAGEGIYPVPSGEHAEAIWRRLEHDGLNVIKGLLASNNPVPRKNFGELFELMTRAVQVATGMCS